MDLRGCVPLAVRESLLAGVHEPEHRRVTVAFIHFDGTDASIEVNGADATARLLDALMGGVQRCADRQGIAFLGTDIDRDGGKIILTAGAPSTSEHDDLRMLLALREIMDNHQALPLRVGVHRGFVFAGDIGPHYRRTFTVMGDAVNLTARLMAKAQPGQILSTPDVLEQSGVEVETVELEPFFVKGKAKPVRAFVVGRVAEARSVGTGCLHGPRGTGRRARDPACGTGRRRAGRGRARRVGGRAGGREVASGRGAPGARRRHEAAQDVVRAL